MLREKWTAIAHSIHWDKHLASSRAFDYQILIVVISEWFPRLPSNWCNQGPTEIYRIYFEPWALSLKADLFSLALTALLSLSAIRNV